MGPIVSRSSTGSSAGAAAGARTEVLADIAVILELRSDRNTEYALALKLHMVSPRGDVMARKSTRKSTASRRKRPVRSRKSAHTSSRRRWSQHVTEHSDAMTLDRGVFSQRDPKRIAASLKRSAERSRRRKSDPFRSALSMLTFYINRAGRNLPASRKKTLMRAKDELRKQFGRD
jgi:hypothetical protein